MAGSQDAVFDPIVNDVAADAEVFGDLLDGQFFGVPEYRFGNPMAVADPLDHRGVEGLSGRAAAVFLVEAFNDLIIAKLKGEFADALHQLRGIAQLIRPKRR